jgi:hypothetical protein
MSEEISTFNSAPYFDDYDEEKKYYRILFKPGYSVQARELTQLQTILQKQIQRHGDNIFQDGAMVVPGQTSVDTNYAYVKVQNTFNGGTQVANYTDQLVGATLVGQTSGVTAQVVMVIHTNSVDPETLYVKYTSSGTNTTTKVFADNEALVPSDASLSSLGVQSITSGSTGVGSAASIGQGVYYIGGFFCLVDAQTIILDKYTNTPSYIVGLNVSSGAVTSDTDPSLLDNALGAYNYSAPGADRMQIELTLAALPQGTTNTPNFVQLFSVVGGVIQQMVDTTAYSVIADTMAQRTYDQAGDFTVTPATLDVREHYNNNRGLWYAGMTVSVGDVVTNSAGNTYVALVGGIAGTSGGPVQTTGTSTDGQVTWSFNATPTYNRGIYTPEQGGDATQLALGLEPLTAYVRGYQLTKVATDYLAVPKARVTSYAENQKVTATVGNYVLVTNVNGIPKIDQLATVNMYDQMTVTPGVQSVGNLVGTAKVRFFQWVSGTFGTTSAVYMMGLFGVTMNTGKNFATNVKQFFINYGSSPLNFSADISPVLTLGTGSVSASASTTITGNGTLFLSDCVVGDYVSLGAAGGVRRVTAIASNVSMTVSAAVTVTNETFNVLDTVLNDPGDSTTVWQMPNYAIETVRSSDNTIGTSYTIQERFTGTANTSGVLTIAVNGGNDTFASTALTSNYVAVDNTTGAILNPVSITLNGPLNTQATLTFTASQASHSISVIAAINREGSGTEKTKTLTTGTLTLTTQAAATAATIQLPVADGYLLTSVMQDTGTFAQPTGIYTTDVTSNYEFKDGQTDSYYGLASIKLSASGVPPSAPILITYQYFAHSVTGDYFTVNSYLSTMPYENIPYYNGMPLRDCIDFRSRISTNGADFVSSGSVVNGCPVRGIDVEANYTYYLGRQDKLAIGTDGTFFDVQGVSSLNPVLPDDPTTAMVVFTINLEPYTFGTASANVAVTTIDNKRYTMRDIGAIDKRVTNLEYYTALSLLEQQTASMNIPDATTGLSRYQNGFIVDSFNGHGVGNTSSADYMCSIDMTNQMLRPFFSMSNITLIENNTQDSQRTTAGYQLTGDVITLPYTEIAMITQPAASDFMNVNPFAVYLFVGTTDLNPASDSWFDTYQLPDIVTNVDGNFNTILTLAQDSGVLGTVWNAWQTQWTGASTTTDTTYNYGVHTNTYSVNGGPLQLRPTALDNLSNGVGQARTLVTSTTATTVGQSRTGVTTSIVPQITNTVTADNVVATAVIPYMRSRNIQILSRGLKPSTTFYPFFDSTAVGAYVTPSTALSYTAIAGYASVFDYQSSVGGLADEYARTISGNTDNALNTGDVVYVVQRGSTTYSLANTPATAVVGIQETHADGSLQLQVQNVMGSFLAGDIIVGSLSSSRGTLTATPTVANEGDPLVSNFNGDVVALFQIPDTTAMCFRTGTRVFTLSDDSADGPDASSYSSVQYTATGILDTMQAYVTSTRNAELVQTQVSETQTVVQTSTAVVSDTGWWDPLAQTFLINQTDGAFLTSVDLYFQSKDTNIPVQVEIRDVVNGYPGSTILPFSHVTLTPDQVNVSSDATVATRFQFASPVYVNDATSYCVVVMSDSNAYNCWIATLGDKVVNSDSYISQQPYTGVLFESKNNSTWTANENSDLKFILNRASFVTGQYGEVEFVNQNPDVHQLAVTPFQTGNGSKLVRVLDLNHGNVQGSTVTIAGVTANVNGIPFANLNGNFVISNVTFDSYVITVATAATQSGIGGNAGITATGDVPYDTIQPIVDAQAFTDTTTSWFIKTTTGQSPLGGGETPYVLDSVYYPVTVNDNNDVGNTCVVASVPNQTASILAGSKSLWLKGRMFTNNESVSPFIDMDRLSAIAVRNRVDTPTLANSNVAALDDITIVTADTQLSFSGNTMTTTDAATMAALQLITAGNYITITGGSNAGTWLTQGVTVVSGVSVTVTISSTFVTQATGTAVSIVCHSGFVDETAPIDSSTISKYVSTEVQFTNTSTYLQVILAEAVPPAANVLVYYKTNPAGLTNGFGAIPYTLLQPQTPAPYTTNQTFTDVTYSVQNLPSFDAVQIKIVMQSTDTSQPPLLKDLRIIACA